jgi:hypothetical protein
MHKRLKAYAQHTGGRDYATILIEAFELHHGEIDQLFPIEDSGPVVLPPPEGRLFPVRQPAARARVSEVEEGTRQVNFTLAGPERDVLDELVDAHQGVSSRNALIVKILGLHLDEVEPS